MCLCVSVLGVGGGGYVFAPSRSLWVVEMDVCVCESVCVLGGGLHAYIRCVVVHPYVCACKISVSTQLLSV